MKIIKTIINSASVLFFVAGVLVLFTLLYGALGHKAHIIDKSIPIPYCLPEHQPNCVASALTMYAVAKDHVYIAPNDWPGVDSKSAYSDIPHMLTSWHITFSSQLHEREDIQFNTPYIWIGQLQGGYHACLIYFTPTNGTLLNYVYDATTHTNYMETHDYLWIVSNTASMYTD